MTQTTRVSIDTPVRLFIVGCPRSGTTWLIRAINTLGLAAGIGESRLFTSNWIEPGSDGTIGIEDGKSVLAGVLRGNLDSTVPLSRGEDLSASGRLESTSREDFEELRKEVEAGLEGRGELRVADVLEVLGAEIARREGRRNWVEKTAEHALAIARLQGEFPNAHVIGLYRPAGQFLLSYKNQGRQASAKVRRRHVRRYHPLGGMLVWRRSIQAMKEARDMAPDRVEVFRLGGESDFEKVLQRVADLLGADGLTQQQIKDVAGTRVNSSVTSSGASRLQELDAADRFFIRVLGGESIEPVNGGGPVTACISIAWSLIRLPYWGVNVAIDLARNNARPFEKAYAMLFSRPLPRRAQASGASPSR